jgi:selenocysteine-specific elongation factor
VCSAQTGDGIDDVHDALQELLSRSMPATGPLQSFLPVDRVFSLPGRGTIVTGTLLGQDLTVTDTVTLLPNGRTTTFRGLQSRGTARDVVHTSERVAANLRGVAVSDVTRGTVLTVGPYIAPSHCFDVTVEMLATASRPLKHMEQVRVLFGTSSEVAHVRLFGGGRIAPPNTGFAQLRFKNPVVGFAGQKAILRFLSPAETIAGAVVLDPNASLVKSGDKAHACLLEALQTRDAEIIANALCNTNSGVANLADVARLSRVSMHAAQAALIDGFEKLDNRLLSSKQIIDACKTEILDALNNYHAKHPLHMMAPQTAIATLSISPVLSRHIQNALLATGHIRRHDTLIAAIDHDPIALLSKDQRARYDNIESAFRSGGLVPPAPDSIAQTPRDGDLIKLLTDTGRLVALHNVSLKQTLVFHVETLTRAAATLRTTFPSPQVFTTSQARAAFGTSRRIIVPVLEHFDTQGLTVRTGNNRQMVLENSVSPPDPT